MLASSRARDRARDRFHQWLFRSPPSRPCRLPPRRAPLSTALSSAQQRYLGRPPQGRANRPVQQETARAAVLALRGSASSSSSSEGTPVVMIAALRPDVLVKGADYCLVGGGRRRSRAMLWRRGRPRRSHCRPQHNGDDEEGRQAIASKAAPFSPSGSPGGAASYVGCGHTSARGWSYSVTARS